MADGFGKQARPKPLRLLYNVSVNRRCRIVLPQSQVLQASHMYYLHSCGSGVQAPSASTKVSVGTGLRLVWRRFCSWPTRLSAAHRSLWTVSLRASVSSQLVAGGHWRRQGNSPSKMSMTS